MNHMAPFPRIALIEMHYQFKWHFNDRITNFRFTRQVFSLVNCILVTQSSSLGKHACLERDGRQRGKGQEAVKDLL